MKSVAAFSFFVHVCYKYSPQHPFFITHSASNELEYSSKDEV